MVFRENIYWDCDDVYIGEYNNDNLILWNSDKSHYYWFKSGYIRLRYFLYWVVMK